MEGLQWARGNSQTFVGWGGGLGIRLDSKASIPGEEAAGWRAESAVLRRVQLWAGSRGSCSGMLSSPRRRGGGGGG